MPGWPENLLVFERYETGTFQGFANVLSVSPNPLSAIGRTHSPAGRTVRVGLNATAAKVTSRMGSFELSPKACPIVCQAPGYQTLE